MKPTEERCLNGDEVRLVRWLLENGEQGAASYLSSMDELRIVWTCDCGCASVGFIRGAVGPMEILADFGLKSGGGGVLLFARGDTSCPGTVSNSRRRTGSSSVAHRAAKRAPRSSHRA